MIELSDTKKQALQRCAAAYIKKYLAEQALKGAHGALQQAENDAAHGGYLPKGAYTCALDNDPTLVTITVDGHRPYTFTYTLSEPLYAEAE